MVAARWWCVSTPTRAHFRRLRCRPEYNEQFDLAVVRGNGALSWDIGNLPGSNGAIAQDFVLTYGQPYRVNGWTVLPSVNGTRFTNDQTGHGMFINLDTVDPF